MLQSFKKLSWILLLACGLQNSWAFSLLGPANGYTGGSPISTPPTGFGDAWEVIDIGFNPIPNNTGAPPFLSDTLGTGPKNIGEEYRRNTPVMFYACDVNFLDYFGSNGVVAIDGAFAMMNSSLTNLNTFSIALTEFPLSSQAVNYQASAAGLLDIKSQTLSLLMEQLGLADPIRYVWCLHNRFQPGNTTCPFFTTYQVVMRNYDITTSPLSQVQYSPYINGSLYTYYIYEICDAPANPPHADAYEFLVDPLVNNPPVAAVDQATLTLGSFYTSLTRDDVAGLRYLLDTNNINFESPASGSVLLNSTQSGGTNYGAPFPLFTSDLTTFILAAKNTDPVTLSNLYPGLIITSSSATFGLLKTTNYVAYFTNLIGAPAGSQTLVIVKSGVTQTIVTNYTYTFANIVTNTYHSTSTSHLLVVQAQPLSGAPAGSLTTNVTVQTITSKIPSGDFYINTNVCGPDLIISTLATNVTTTNQIILSATNAAGLFYAQSKVTTSITHILIAQPVLCPASGGGGTTTNSPGLYQGISKIQFVKTTYDSLVGQFYQPITNTYSQVLVFNSKPIKQTFQRIVIQPDILFSAADLLPGPGVQNSVEPRYSRSISFDMSHIYPGLAGPGIINNPSSVIFDKVGPVFLNQGTGSLFQTNGILDEFIWGSFDGSTNDPVVYPNGTSLANLVNQILVQISPATLPIGTNHVVYPATTFVATGGSFNPPYTWSLTSGSALPAGLALSSGGSISGTPTRTGTFDFTLQLTDSLARTVTWNYSITIN